MRLAKPRVLLLSAYDAVSHRHWRTWLADTFDEYEWTSLPLPDRHFYWRIRSNALTYLSQHAAELVLQYELIVATSMVDVGMLRALCPQLAAVPTIVYFHENQFAYPVSESQSHRSNIINAQLNTIFSGLCADKLVFNSRYNRQTYIDGAKALLRKMPDGVDVSVIDACNEKSVVLPVPIITSDAPPKARIRGQSAPELVWNHRWEYDKQPEVFFEAMTALAAEGFEFKLHVVGQHFRNVPSCFAAAADSLSGHIVSWGHQPADTYYQILDQSDIVVSTALHDFQGLSMLEAIHRGCVPLAPNRVAYPEYIPEQMLYDVENEAQALASVLRRWFTNAVPPVPSVSNYLDAQLTAEYRTLLGEAINQ